MRGPSRWIALGTITFLLSSCSHWYARGAMAVGGAAALGYGGGSLIPCTMDAPDCHGSNAIGGAAVMASTALFLWGMAELVIAIGPTSSDDDGSGGYSGGGSSGDDDSSSGGGGDETSGGGDETSGGGDDPSDDSCHATTYGASTDTSIEPELFASGDDQVRITSGGTGQGESLAEACGEAKMYAFGYLRDRCPSIRTESTYLTQWIVYRQECTCNVCPDSMGGFPVDCNVHVEGICQVAADVVAEHGYGWGSDDASATNMAFGYARGRCVGPEVSSRVLGCDSGTHGGEERHVCHVAVVCRRQ